MEIKISEVNIIPIKPQNGLIAFASLIFNEYFYLGGIGVYTKIGGGYRCTYPTKKSGEVSLPIYYPINKEIGELITQAISDKYEEIMSGNEENQNNNLPYRRYSPDA